MTTRTTALGIAALLLGAVTLVLTDGVLPTVLGLVALVVGAAVTAVAGLRGMHDTPEASQRAAHAEQRRDGQVAAQHQRAMETGRWPRVIGGG